MIGLAGVLMLCTFHRPMLVGIGKKNENLIKILEGLSELSDSKTIGACMVSLGYYSLGLEFQISMAHLASLEHSLPRSSMNIV